jgi:hypothetical protein
MKKYDIVVAFNGTNFVPSFVKIDLFGSRIEFGNTQAYKTW